MLNVSLRVLRVLRSTSYFFTRSIADRSTPGGRCASQLHVRERERPLVGAFGDLFVRGPVAMRPQSLDANQHWLVTPLRALQRCRELERVARHDPVVVISGRDQRRGIAGAWLEVVERRELGEGREDLRLLPRSLLCRPRAGAAGVQDRALGRSNRRGRG